MTKQSLDWILKKTQSLQGVNAMVSVATSVCGKDVPRRWICGDDKKEGYTAIEYRSGLPEGVMSGYKPVNCPDCIKVLKKNGL